MGGGSGAEGADRSVVERVKVGDGRFQHGTTCRTSCRASWPDDHRRPELAGELTLANGDRYSWGHDDGVPLRGVEARAALLAQEPGAVIVAVEPQRVITLVV